MHTKEDISMLENTGVLRAVVLEERCDQDDFTVTKPDTCAVIVAGGAGERFGDPRGKQFVDICGLPMTTWSILAFDKAPSIGAIVVVCPKGRLQEMKDCAVDVITIDKPVFFAEAGYTRQESVLNGLACVPDTFDIVSIHDGARPLITSRAIEDAIAPLRENITLDGTVCGQPSIDTLKIVDGHNIVSTPNRAFYWAAQTPQTFRRAKIIAVHTWAKDTGVVGTDDSSLVEKYGGTVICVASPRDNIKVTLPEDLRPVSAILEGRLIEAGRRRLC